MPKMTLAEAREIVGLNQSRLARKAGQPVSNIADIEDGSNKNPSFVLVMAITNALRAAGMKRLKPEDIFSIERVS